jgi:hypothetical protein
MLASEEEHLCSVCKSKLRYVDKVEEWYCETCKTFPMNKKDKDLMSKILLAFVIIITISMVITLFYQNIGPENTGDLRVIYRIGQHPEDANDTVVNLYLNGVLIHHIATDTWFEVEGFGAGKYLLEIRDMDTGTVFISENIWIYAGKTTEIEY